MIESIIRFVVGGFVVVALEQYGSPYHLGITINRPMQVGIEKLP